MKIILKSCLMIPFRIIYFVFNLYEKLLSLILGQELASLGRTYIAKNNGKFLKDINHISSSKEKFNAIVHTPNQRYLNGLINMVIKILFLI